jgi:agmatine/peptidylarginine deiminase
MIANEGYRMPAEWEPQSGVQLTWPHAQTDWAPILDEITVTYEEMAREIAKREPLIIVAPSHIPIVNCQLSIINSNDTWARDHGFITLVATSAISHQPSAIKLLDFCFNGWGCKFEAGLDNAINRRLYDEGRLQGEYVDCLDFVLEGGSIESDGKGTIFTTTGCLMAPHRNQPHTKEQIEEELLRRLCAKRIVWINHGQLIGDDTDGHIDTLVRICPDDTLLYMACDDPEDEQYEELRLMEEELKTLRTLDGKPYRLLRLPSPRPLYESAEGVTSHLSPLTSHLDRLPATYANFLIINGAVLVPTYAQPDLDAEACRIIAQAFPDREIVPIDSRSIIRQHGSIHCCTMQFPLGVLP